MQEISRVNTEGIWQEGVIVDSRATSPVAEIRQQGPTEGEAEVIGYYVSIPVPDGFHLPKFDLQKWQDYVAERKRAEDEFFEATHTWYELPEEERGPEPVYSPIPVPECWMEGATEIPEIPHYETDAEKIARLEEEATRKDAEIGNMNSSIIDLWETVLGGGV